MVKMTYTRGTKTGLVKGTAKKVDPNRVIKAPHLIGKTGPKPREIDWALVERLAKVQCTATEIAAILDIDYNALTSRPEWASHYNKGAINGRKSLRRKQFEVALYEGHPTMLMFLGNQYLGQVNTTRQQLTGADNGPVKVEGQLVDLRKLSKAELAQLQSIMEKAQAEDTDSE